jgi:hypothetical protein
VRNMTEPQPCAAKQGSVVRGWILLAFSVLMVAVGVNNLTKGDRLATKAAESASWPATDGVVKTAEFVEHKQMIPVGRRGRSTYQAELAYDYSVNGKQLTGHQIRLAGDSSSFQDGPKEDLKKYPVSANVKVFYSPTDPADSILEPGVAPSKSGLLMMRIIGWLLVGFFSLAILFLLRAGCRVPSAN